ncbi:MAG: hypothetical protein SOX04_04510 [Eubacteriales bacterium]|nr:hypothetical protein [Clostridiales bacterium]MDY3241790.1 hypothetical protein [Eubacteriales bacterium]MDY4709847.1 hypothetical protein [Eubacteriales bacterium]
MADIIKFDDTNEYKLERAEDFYDDENYFEALPLLNAVLEKDPGNVDAGMLVARIYAEMNDFETSDEKYMEVYRNTGDTDAIKGIISNMMCHGKFREAKYYKDSFDVDYDFSEFLSVENEDGESLFVNDDNNSGEVKRNFRLIVDRREKGGENLALRRDAKSIGNIFATGFQGENDDIIKFGELMEKLLDFNDETDDEEKKPSKRRTGIGFRQVYPMPDDECEKTIRNAFRLFSEGKPEDALVLLDKITRKNGKYYFIAHKNKVMCYLALNRLSSMRTAAEIAMEGLPDDFSLKCYYYISLKLLEENEEADRIYKEIDAVKPKNSMEYMVKLDACRLAMNHEGVLNSVENVLPEFPYQPQLLILLGKAQYNIGEIKAARATFLDVLRLYPDNFEARLMLDKINSHEGGLMSYGEIEIQIKRVRLLNEIKLALQDGKKFTAYLKYNKDACKNLEFLLLNESDRNVYTVVTALSFYSSARLTRLYEKILLHHDASAYLKTLVLAVYLDKCAPKKVYVSVGDRLKIAEMPSYGWEKGLTDVIVHGAYLAYAQIIMSENNLKPAIIALTERLRRMSSFMLSEKSPRETVRDVMDIDNFLAVRNALYDMSLHKSSNKSPLTLQDEAYGKCLELFGRIDDEYEI